jgi:hypothetical protein
MLFVAPYVMQTSKVSDDSILSFDHKHCSVNMKECASLPSPQAALPQSKNLKGQRKEIKKT